MIPKTIHYCWFGGNEKTELIKFCISSWKEKLPDYQIMEWNENNLDLKINPFVESAYSLKKWAFVSDYFRAHVLFNYGGIYLDTDVEIRYNLDEFLIHKAFSGFEKPSHPFTALWACEKYHSWPKKVLDYYNTQATFSEKTNTEIVSKILIEEFNVNPYNDNIQELKDGIIIYPSSHFCLNLVPNYAVHHFNGSWLDNEIPFKKNLHKNYYRNQYLNTIGREKILNDLFESKTINFSDLSSFFKVKILKKLQSFFK